MRARVYYNLQRQCFSVVDKQKKIVVDYVHHLVLEDVKFIVWKSGQAKVRRTGQKNVHAFVEGDVVPHKVFNNIVDVIYNPFTLDHFVLKNDRTAEIHKAEQVMLTCKLGTPYIFADGKLEIHRELKLLTHEEVQEILAA